MKENNEALVQKLVDTYMIKADALLIRGCNEYKYGKLSTVIICY